MLVAADRAVVELLGDLRVARCRRITAALVEFEASGLERQPEKIEQSLCLDVLLGTNDS